MKGLLWLIWDTRELTVLGPIMQLIKERLDRYFFGANIQFYNSDWRLLFPEAKLIHLAEMSSDHFPLLMNLVPIVMHQRFHPPF